MAGFVEPKKIAIKRDRLERKRSKDKSIDLTILEVIPYKQLTDEGYLMLEDNTYAEFYQFNTQALSTINEDENSSLMIKLANYFRINIEDIKIISFKYPSDTERQQQYWFHKYERTEHPLQKAYIEENIRRLQRSAKVHVESDYYLLVYADTKKSMKTLKENIRQTNSGLLKKEPLSIRKKENVLFQLNNMNTQYL